MDIIGCYLLTEDGKMEPAHVSKETLIKLCEILRTKGRETVYLNDLTIKVAGVFVPAKGLDNSCRRIGRLYLPSLSAVCGNKGGNSIG